MTFDFKVPSSCYPIFSESSIEINGIAMRVVNGNAVALDGTVGIPWNPVAALIQAHGIRLNKNSPELENTSNCVGAFKHGQSSYTILPPMDIRFR